MENGDRPFRRLWPRSRKRLNLGNWSNISTRRVVWGALGHSADDEAHRMLRADLEEEQVREDARNLMLLEWAKELLLDEDGDQ